MTRLALLRASGTLLRAMDRDQSGALHLGTKAGDRPGPRILLIRPDHLGDVLLAGPAGRLLHDALPTAKIDWLVGPWAAEVVRRSGQAGEILTCDFPGFTRRPKGSSWSPYVALVAAARPLRAGRYDAALVLRPDHWWGALLAAIAGIPERIGYAVPECAPFLTRALALPVGMHSVDASLAVARDALCALGAEVSPISPDPCFAVTDEERAWAHRLVEQVARRGEAVVALHPGSGAPVKNCLPGHWAAVARELSAERGVRLVVTGGPDEVALAERIADEVALAARTSDAVAPTATVLAGRTTLGQLAALFARCSLVLGGDSGPLHLAAAMGAPTLRLYGPTSTLIFGPWGDPARQQVIQASLPCQPCGNIAAPPCGATGTPACLRVVEPFGVLAAARELLRRADVRAKAGPPPTPC